MNRTAIVCTSIPSLALLAAAALMAGGGGPLNPPAGPVASTYKTLTEVEPRIAISAANTPGDADSLFKITQSGSYYLTGNVTGVVGKHGIEITAAGVTIDLNGFDLVGVPGMGSFDGVSVTASNLSNIEVRNGSVRNWGDEGLDLGSFFARNNIITNIRSRSNGGHGISGGAGCVIRDCVADANALYGFTTYENSTLQACTAQDNASAGFSIGNGSTISQCSAQSNTGTGFSIAHGCSIIACTAFLNTLSGIVTDHACTVSGCTAYTNSGDGISTGWRSTVAECSAANNGEDGIVTGSGCTIRCCTAYDNSNGIAAGGSCTITGNTAVNQSLDGIRLTSNSIVSGNTCSFNGAGATIGAGIHATGDSNRIESNSCNGNDFGIDIDGSGNIIIRNTCAGDTQAFVIATDNLYGPIIDRRIPTTVPSTPPALGFAATGTMGSTDTNANFAH